MTDLKTLPMTFFLDLDGTILIHRNHGLRGQATNEEIISPRLWEFLEWCNKNGHKVIGTTGRKKSMEMSTELQMERLGVYLDLIIYECNPGIRILVNDLKNNDATPTAHAINSKRNSGDWLEQLSALGFEAKGKNYPLGDSSCQAILFPAQGDSTGGESN